MPGGRRVARVLLLEIVLLAGLLTLALDVSAHRRIEIQGGLNIWGYRGPVARQKKPDEVRVALVGGSRAFSWGAVATGTPAAVIRQDLLRTLDRPGSAGVTVVALNLAQPGTLADSYRPTIERYAYLRPDYICIYDDLGVRGAPPPLNVSGVFAATGYWPALPLVLREKGMLWQFGNVKRGYSSRQRDPAAHTSSVRSIAGALMETVGATAAGIDRRLARRSRAGNAWPGETEPPAYADALLEAADAAHRHARGVILAVSPVETDIQAANLEALKARIAGRLESDRWLRWVDLGEISELRQAALRLDGWNYGAQASTLAGSRIAPAILALIRAR